MLKKIILILILAFYLVLSSWAKSSLPDEQAWVTTDRDVYIAGDWVYFSIKLLNKKTVSDFVYISLNKNNTIIFSGCIKVSIDNAYGSFYLTDTLSTGIYKLVVYTNRMRNFGTECYATKKIIVANRFDDEFSNLITNTPVYNNDTSLNSKPDILPDRYIKSGILLQKDTFSRREKVNFTVQLPKGIKVSNVSITVRKKAPVELPTEKSSVLENFVANPCKYLPEHKGFILQGSIKDADSSPANGKLVFLSCEDSIANLQYTTSEINGDFKFFLNPYYFGKIVVLKVLGKQNYSIITDSKYNYKYSDDNTFEIKGDLMNYLGNSQKFLNIQRSYNQIYRKELQNTDYKYFYRPAAFLKESIKVNPSDYLYLPDFREISRELLPYLKIRDKNGDFAAFIYDADQRDFSIPYIFLDGVLLEHIRQIMYLDSKKIKEIVTVSNNRYIGDLNLPGILSITSNTSEIKNVKWDYPIAKVLTDSPMPYSVYTVPDIKNIPRNIPFYLQLLLWKPDVKIENGNSSDMSFFTSDCTGTFEIVVSGISSEGNNFECRKIFDISALSN